jgi:adenylosuccinate synthase
VNRVVIGLGFGDEGKGSLTDYICRQEDTHTVVRFNGGAQAGHNVCLPDGRHHTFAQFGAGTFAGAKTHLSHYMVFNPIFLEAEEKNLSSVGVENAYDTLTVDEGALVTNPFQVAANRLRELQRDFRHGSCGMGVGETVQDSLEYPETTLRVKDFKDPDALFKKLRLSQIRKGFFRLDSKASEAEVIEASILNDPDLVDVLVTKYRRFTQTFEVVDSRYLQGLLAEKHPLVFEGAQGVLLDEDYGFNPYTTWSRTTSRNALELLGKHPSTTVGVTRAYHTRHGAGPFPSEDPHMVFPDHNCEGDWQGSFRFGPIDLNLLAYAQLVAKCDEVAVTCLDHLPRESKDDERLRVCASYRWDPDKEGTPWPQWLLQNKHDPQLRTLADKLSTCKPVLRHRDTRQEVLYAIRQAVGVPLHYISEGPTYEDKRCL